MTNPSDKIARACRCKSGPRRRQGPRQCNLQRGSKSQRRSGCIKFAVRNVKSSLPRRNQHSARTGKDGTEPVPTWRRLVKISECLERISRNHPA